jgi:hypothetical protein
MTHAEAANVLKEFLQDSIDDDGGYSISSKLAEALAIGSEALSRWENAIYCAKFERECRPRSAAAARVLAPWGIE